MKALFDNKILNSIITSVDASNNFPVDNLKSIYLHQKFQSIDTSDIITIVFNGNIDVDCFFFGYSNMSNMGVSFYDELDVLVGQLDFTSIDTDVESSYFDSTISVKKIIIELENTSSESVYLGGLAVGLTESFNLPLAKWTDDFDDKSIVSESQSGQILQQYIKPFRKYDFTFPVNTRVEVNKVTMQYQQYGVGFHLWVDPFELNHDFMYPLYCTLTAPISAKKDGYNWKFNFNIREAR